MTGVWDVVFSLADYEHGCNLTLVAFLETLRDDELQRDLGFGHRTPHRTIWHIADVMQGWAAAVAPEVGKPQWLVYDRSLSLERIRDLLNDAFASWRSAADLSRKANVLGSGRRLHQFFHIVTHGTHHRGQLLGMLTLMGHEQPIEGGDFGGWTNQ